jgi:hypothetical protein
MSAPTDPRAALALARLLQVVLYLDADQLGDVCSFAEETATASPREPDPSDDPREATRRARALEELQALRAAERVTVGLPVVSPPPAPEIATALDRAAEARLVIDAQRRLEARRQEVGLTADGLRPPRLAARGGDPQVASNVIRGAFRAGTH